MELDQTEAINYRDAFRSYLLNDKFSEHGSDVYLNLLSSVVDFYVQVLVDPDHKTVFEITDVKLLTKYHSILMKEFVFVSKNRSKEKRPESALLKYIEFVKTLNSVHKPEEPVEPNEVPPIRSETPHKHKDSEIKVKLTNQINRQVYIKKVQFIIRPIEKYLNEYGLGTSIAFEYFSAFRDVDVIRPRFSSDLDIVTKELGELVSLMTKYDLQVPLSIRRRLEIADEQKELRENVRDFENWIVGYMTYLRAEDIEVDSISYSPSSGFRIDIKGKDIAPISISMKTSVATAMYGTVSVRKKKI